MFDPSVWGWPQWALFLSFFAITTLNLAGVFLGAKERRDELVGEIILRAVVTFLLVMGGFFA